MDIVYHHTTNQLRHHIKSKQEQTREINVKDHMQMEVLVESKIRDTLPSHRLGRERCHDGEEV